MKTSLIVRRLLYQNRWLYLVLLLWPLGMAALLLWPSGAPQADDVQSILHQECLYGLGLVAFTGSALLGNEQRSRRIAAVLARAVSRRQYFGALVLAAWLPLTAYVTSFLVSGVVLFHIIDRPVTPLFALALALLVLGVWTAAAALFFASWLPGLVASTASLASLGLLSWLGYVWPRLASLRLLSSVTLGDMDRAASIGQHPASLLLALLGAAALIAAGDAVFARRDLRLKTD